MKPDDQEKRLNRIIAVSWFAILLLLIAIVVVGSMSLKESENRILAGVEERLKNYPMKSGKDGQNGYTPIKGVDYFDGQDGRNGENALSVTTLQPVYTNVPVQGPEGPEGPQGKPGKTIIIRTNPETKAEECRYLGDIQWQAIENCGL